MSSWFDFHHEKTPTLASPRISRRRLSNLSLIHLKKYVIFEEQRLTYRPCVFVETLKIFQSDKDQDVWDQSDAKIIG